MGISRGNITTNIIKSGLVFNLDAANRASYPKTGTTAIDTVDNVNGTLTNGTAFSNNNNGTFELDGVNDYIACQSLVIPSFVSLNAWCRPDTVSSTQMIATADDSADNNRSWQFRVDSNAKPRILLFYNNDSTNESTIGTTSISADTWVNICATYDNVNLNIYINGVLDGTTSLSGGAINDSGATGDFAIGTRKTSTGGDDFFNGEIANVQVYNRGLSSTEVLHNYNALKGRFE